MSCSNRRGQMFRWLLWTLALSSIGSTVPSQLPAQPRAIFIVRHAEKADNSDDPVLSAAGQARAQALAAVLEHAEIEHAIVTHRQRTRLTAAPLLAQRALTPEVISFGADGVAAHIDSIVAAIRRQHDKAVLVVGHSNTVLRIVHALGGPRLPDLCDARYSALFTVVPSRTDSATPTVAVASFGTPDPPGADSCPGMVPRD